MKHIAAPVSDLQNRIRIVQCWDDGVEDDIRLCQFLRERGAKASFNLNPGLHEQFRGFTWRYQNTKDVRRLARSELTDTYAGFTIANHTVTHPWPLKISAAEWRREVVDGRKMLQDIFGQPIHGFAYPFGQRNELTDSIVREAGHLYARGTGPDGMASPHFPPADPLRFVPDCHFKDPHLIAKYAAAKAAGATVFYFWGHSYEFLTEADWQRFLHQLDYFNADPNAVWGDLPELFPPSA